MSAVIAVLHETGRLDPARFRWPLRIAARDGGEITFVVPAAGEATTQVSLAGGDEAADELAGSLRALLDTELTPDGWVVSAPDAPDAPAGAEVEPAAQDGAPIRVALLCVPARQIVAALLPLAADVHKDLVVAVIEKPPREMTVWREITRDLLRDVGSPVVVVVPGHREADGEILFRPTSGPYGRMAAPLALELARRHGRKATGLWVEPALGPDSEAVGGKLLDRELAETLGDDAAGVARRVEVLDPPESGILQACADGRYELFITGIARPAGSGFAEGQLVTRLSRGTDEPTLIFTRAAIPLRSRLQRVLHSNLRRAIPQLERAERIDFVARVQSSSAWDFDFVALMVLATSIATLGLIESSASVIIGAMLVAPLMTPLMGIGLSLVQGNLRLASMTSKTAALGFLLAFVTAFCIGALDPEFGLPTDEMYARHWPALVDVALAFVAGLAAAYASGRPGLLAALPGVAIAASLVPPIAVSGLALSIGYHDLALGAILLFAVNVVAIVSASALVLWSVGLHSRSGLSRPARVLAACVTTLAIATAFAAAIEPPMSTPPLGLVEQVEIVLGDDYRLRDVTLRRERGQDVLEVDLGGSIDDHPTFSADLVELARLYLGKGAVVRVTFRHETMLR